MKKIAILFLFLVTFGLVSAQIYNPVKWSTDAKQINENEAELIITATIENNWHLYSQFLPSADGPIATEFKFEKQASFELSGKTLEKSKVYTEYDPNFEMDLNFFKNKAVFVQKIKLKGNVNQPIKGTVFFMVCDDSKCLPPEEIELTFNLKTKITETSTGQNTSSIAQNQPTDSLIPDTSLQAQTPQETIKETPQETQKPVSETKGIWGIFIAGFFGGLLALLTPCVFPMIPLTVNYFTGEKSKLKGITDALIYGISIIVIYVGIGFLITKLLGPDALNALASNVWVNLAFFFIFLIFAISFLGAFEIVLPSWLVNKADSASNKGGLLGIFFMAFTLSLVSFSCTGPIIGTLLVEAAVSGKVLGPIMGMAGFSVALALPFGLFAAFPSWLNSLPRSGGWLNSVKVVLGLLELALALKFFSNVDLAYHWQILTREVFIALWIIIFTIMGFYLLGKIKFSHDSDVKFVSIPRLIFAIITFAFVVYLVPGMWGAPLKLISGFPPPMFYTEGWTLGAASSSAPAANQAEEIAAGIDRTHCPHNLPCFHDYDQAKAYAIKTGKPLMIDFTGWSCVNCRKMEDKVWIDPRVLKKLSDDYVLVSLYVDDKTELPENEQYVSSVTGKKIKTIGNKWSDFQTSRFKTNSQPWYVLLDHEEKELNEPTGYDPNIEKYLLFLDTGLKEFSSRKK